jgi:hypothetical protein
MYTDVGRNKAYNVQDLIGKNVKNKYLSGNSLAWVEYGLTYAHVFKDEGKHFFKAGVTPKLLQGIAAAYINVKDLEFRFDNDALSINNDSLQLLAIAKTQVNYAHSENLEFPSGQAPNRFQNSQANSPRTLSSFCRRLPRSRFWRSRMRGYSVSSRKRALRSPLPARISRSFCPA